MRGSRAASALRISILVLLASHVAPSTLFSQSRTLELLPSGRLYDPYLADPKESRFSAVWLHEAGIGWLWEGSMGGRFPVVRYGSDGPGGPDGWQLDLEGAAFARLDVGQGTPLDAVDFRVGVLASWRQGPLALETGYTHLSSHVGDEFLERNPGFVRRDYVRDSVVMGVRRELAIPVSVYGELGWAVDSDGGAEPLEFRVGTEYTPAAPGHWRGAPFAALDVHLREEFDFAADVNLLAGWRWRPSGSGPAMRAGVQYYNGRALQHQFFDKDEELLGTGLWFDF